MRRLAWLSLLLLAAAACTEEITSPGPCPDFCPPAQIQVVDTVIAAGIEQDSSFSGYVDTHRAVTMQITTGGVAESHGVLRFTPFTDSMLVDTSSADLRPIIAIDSFSVNFVLSARSADAGELELLVHRLPISVDSTTAYQDLRSIFGDSVELASKTLTPADTTDSVAVVLPGDAFPTLEEDSLVAAVGVSLQSVEPAFVDIKTSNQSVNAVSITRFVQVDSADGQPAARSDTAFAAFDTFVHSEIQAPQPTALVVGGTPSTRTFLHVVLPSRIVDSSSVVRATLMLVPTEPVVGAPGDSIRVLAQALLADIGPKSPIRQIPSDSVEAYSGLATVGTSDTLHIDVTHIITRWKDDADATRSFLLRAVREAGALAEFRFNSSVSALGGPALHVTYVPPAEIGN